MMIVIGFFTTSVSGSRTKTEPSPSSAGEAPLLVCLGRHDDVVPWPAWGRRDLGPGRGLRDWRHQPFVEEPEKFVEPVASWVG